MISSMLIVFFKPSLGLRKTMFKLNCLVKQASSQQMHIYALKACNHLPDFAIYLKAFSQFYHHHHRSVNMSVYGTT